MTKHFWWQLLIKIKTEFPQGFGQPILLTSGQVSTSPQETALAISSYGFCEFYRIFGGAEQCF